MHGQVADGIASRTCARMRQLSLQHAAHLTVRRILLARQQHQLQTRHGSDPILNKPDEFHANEHRPLVSDSQVTADEPDCLRVMFRLIQHLFDDPVDAVFIDALVSCTYVDRLFMENTPGLPVQNRHDVLFKVRPLLFMRSDD